MRAVGGDLAGMSTVPEVIAARHLGIRCLGISVVTNMAAGVVEGKLGHDEVLAVGAEAQPRLTALLREVLPALATLGGAPPHCAPCRARARSAIFLRSTGCSPTSGSPASRTISFSTSPAPSWSVRERRSRPDGSRGPLVDAVLDELARARRPSLRRVLNATGVLVHTNLGRAPLAEAALARVVEVGAGYSNLEYDLEARGARIAAGSSRVAPSAPHGRRGRPRGQQQRRGGAARARRARRRPRGGGLARRADRDRGRLPHPGGARALRRASRGGGDDEPDACCRLRARDRARDRRSASGAPVELPSRGLLRAAAARRARRGRAEARRATRRRPRARVRSPASATSRRRPRASEPEPISSASPGDKLLGGPQAGIVVGRAGSGGDDCGVIRSSARFGRTS